MSRRSWAGFLALLLLLLGLAALPQPARGPTLLAKEAGGLRLLGRYLEAEGSPVIGWDRPLAELPGGRGLLLIGTPLRRPFDSADQDALRRFLLTGGAVAVLLGGSPTGPDHDLLDVLGVDTGLRTGLPGSVEAAMAELEAPLALQPVREGDAPIYLRQPTFYLRPRPEDEVRYRWPDGKAAVALHRPPAAALGAQVLVIPAAEPFTNAGLRANLPALLPLIAELGGDERLIVDHVHQGILAPETAEAEPSTLPMDLLLGHLLLLYVAAVFALARRFAPQVLAPPPPRSSTLRDLRVLAALHRRGGHAASVGARLLRELAILSRGRSTPLVGDPPLRNEADLLALTRTIGQHQHDKTL